MVTIIVIDKDRRPIDAALGDVNRDAGQFEAGLAGHGAVRREPLPACFPVLGFRVSLLPRGG
ncbi:MAG TPA: hypothetical protein VFY12_00790 [Arenimonas sp.]|nr:hypothetical protein [Arenimonas sp.]